MTTDPAAIEVSGLTRRFGALTALDADVRQWGRPQMR